MFPNLSLNHRLLKALEEMGFQQPTPVQEAAVPLAVRRKDLMVSAETGSGKTIAYLLPMLNRLLAKTARKQGSRALVLVPTRELARQVQTQCQILAKYTKLDTALICGGDDIHAQIDVLAQNPEIIIATPGRLIEHLQQGSADFDGLEVLVLDEADRMLDMGFSEDVLAIAAQCNDERQTLLFSATLHQEGLSHVADQVLVEPEVVELNRLHDQHENIRQQVILADDNAHKERLLVWLLAHESFEKALVFCNTRDQADRLGGVLIAQKHRTGVLHGDKEQIKRVRVMEQFQEGNLRVLVATDVAARGLDVKGIDLVVNFDMARSGDEHVHRVGRTGRAGEQGLAITLIGHQEWNLMASVERYLRTRFERRTIKELIGSYKGPQKLKSSGKAAGSKKKDKAKKKPTAGKTKARQRAKK